MPTESGQARTSNRIPSLSRLQSCDSADTVITLRRDQVPAFSQPRSSGDAFSNWLVPTLNILNAFSAALWPREKRRVSSSQPRLWCRYFHLAKVIFVGIEGLLSVRVFHNFRR